jgi:hypothetical protein
MEALMECYAEEVSYVILMSQLMASGGRVRIIFRHLLDTSLTCYSSKHGKIERPFLIQQNSEISFEI